MDFVYAPPPPPPPKEDKKQNHSSQYNSSNLSQKRMQLKRSHTPPVQPIDIMDLPTYLPNEQTPEVRTAAEEKKAPVETVQSEPVFIQGTSISLQTEEDIAKWIAERKKNWPTRKNVESKAVEKKAPKRPAEDPSPETKRPKNICRFFQQHKHCKYGTKCKNVHETSQSAIPSNKHDSTHYRKTINGIPVLIPKLYSSRNTSNTPQGLSLFKNLVQKDQYEHENNLVLDFIQYLDKEGKIDHEVMKKK